MRVVWRFCRWVDSTRTWDCPMGEGAGWVGRLYVPSRQGSSRSWVVAARCAAVWSCGWSDLYAIGGNYNVLTWTTRR